VKQAEITFKSGATIAFNVNDLTVHHSRTSGDLVGIDWDCEGLSRWPLSIHPAEVAAIVIFDDAR